MSVEQEGYGVCEVWSYTIVDRNDAPEGWQEFAPYALALITIFAGTEDERLVTMKITDLDPTSPLSGQLEIDDEVEIVTRLLHGGGEEGLRVYGPAARKIE